MNEIISPKYQMELTSEVEKAIWKEYGSYKSVKNYIGKWYEYDENNDWENFRIFTNEENKIDLNSTLHSIPGDILLKIAIELGVDTPDFIPSIPTFKNKLKSDYKTAYETFRNAYRQIEVDPSLAIGLVNSALESIIKEILNDKNIGTKIKGNETLYKLVTIILKEFNITNSDHPIEIKTIGSSLLAICQAIEKLRSEKTNFHGKMENDFIITESIYSYFVVNSVATVGLFLDSYFKNNYKSKNKVINDYDDLPF